jgi:hypothetical protein
VFPALSDKSWDLNVDKEVSSILDKIALLMKELAVRVNMLHTRRKYIGVEPWNKRIFNFIPILKEIGC